MGVVFVASRHQKPLKSIVYVKKWGDGVVAHLMVVFGGVIVIWGAYIFAKTMWECFAREKQQSIPFFILLKRQTDEAHMGATIRRLNIQPRPLPLQVIVLCDGVEGEVRERCRLFCRCRGIPFLEERF